MYLLGVRAARNVTDFAVKPSHRRARTTGGPVTVKLGARLGGQAGAKWICPVPRWPGADGARDTTFELLGRSPLHCCRAYLCEIKSASVLPHIKGRSLVPTYY